MNQNKMKQKYEIEIADVQLSILTDESEEFVKDIVSRLDTLIRTLTVQNKRCAKIDAALLCALDALGEKVKLEKKIKNLETQISLYEANLRRLRTDDTAAEASDAKAVKEEKPAAPKEEAKPKKQAAKSKAEETQEKKASAEKPSPRADKVKEIETLLRPKNETEALKEKDNGGDKIRQIEDLLRGRPSGDAK